MNFDFQRGETRIDDARVVAERCFGEDELFFAGHFPSNKILPGVMLMEYALYLGHVYLMARNDARRLSEIVNVKFLAPVVPGMTVRCDCEFVEAPAGALTMKAVLTRDDVICAKVRATYGGS